MWAVRVLSLGACVVVCVAFLCAPAPVQLSLVFKAAVLASFVFAVAAVVLDVITIVRDRRADRRWRS